MLYGGRRDINLFISVNKELIERIVSCNVDVFKLDIVKSEVDELYGEGVKKRYLPPIRISAYVQYDEVEKDSGIFDKNVIFDPGYKLQIWFMRDTLIEKNVTLEIGDIIFWDGKFFEITYLTENYVYMNRDPDNVLSDNINDQENINAYYGWRYAIGATCALVTRDIVML